MAEQKYIETDKVSYENRAVAFIDILGWKDKVEESITSAELRERLLNAAWFLREQTNKDAEEHTPDFPSFDQASQFSDNVVISLPYSGHRDLLRLIRQISGYQTIMMSSGFPLRGGIAVGPLYHQGPFVFGPALNAAYALESKWAVFPRVVISKLLNKEVKKAARLMPRHWPFVLSDRDGFYYPDYLATFTKSERSKDYIDQKIEYWLSAHKDNIRVHEKYEWLRIRWEAVKVGSHWSSQV